MGEEATHRTAGRVQEEGAIPVVQHQEMGRQHLEAQSLLLVQPSSTSTLLILQQIVVEALTRNVKEDHVREIFGKYGTIKELRMPMNPTFNINRGIAYILYEEIDDAERAIAKMHDAQLDGAKIQVSIVLPRRRFSQTPPPARRGPPPRDDYDGGYGRGGRAPRGGGPPGAYRPPPMDGPSRYRSPPRRMSPDRGHWGRGRGGGGRGGRGGYGGRPRSYTRSRSRSPRRSMSRSSYSRSPSRTPPRRSGGGGYGRRDSLPRRGGRGGGGRRSPSYSSYGSDRSRSRDRR
ncbi:hypothetical protein CUC08_Gglean009101 [Alternaria sp. MG1]|nr:hypothetical protein CUC08_Gglean009101 [Alternaria sp. MG1]